MIWIATYRVDGFPAGEIRADLISSVMSCGDVKLWTAYSPSVPQGLRVLKTDFAKYKKAAKA